MHHIIVFLFLFLSDMIMHPVHLVTWFGLLVLCPQLISASCFTCGSNATVLNYWPSKYFNARFEIPITSNVSGGWNVALKFSKPVIDVKVCIKKSVFFYGVHIGHFVTYKLTRCCRLFRMISLSSL